MQNRKLGNYSVGFSKPPEGTRFQKGRSGNPKGRPKRATKTIGAIFHDELNRRLTITEGGRRQTITVGQAAVRQLLNQGIKGDHGAFRTALQFAKVSGYFNRKAKNTVIEVTTDVPLPPHIKTAEDLRKFNEQPWRNRPRALIRTKSDGTDEITIIPSQSSQEPTE